MLENNIHYSSLFNAASDDNLIDIEKLIAEGVDVNFQTSAGHTALMGVRNTDTGIEIAKHLIAAKADVNLLTTWGVSALHRFAAMGNPELIETTIKAGAIVDQVSDNGHTPFMHLCLHKQPDIQKTIDMFVKYGADINKKDHSNRTPLENAKLQDNSPVLLALLKHPVEQFIKNKPLAFKIKGEVPYFEEFIKHGGDIHAEAKNKKQLYLKL